LWEPWRSSGVSSSRRSGGSTWRSRYAFAIEFAVFGGAAVALAATGRTALAIAFAVVAAISGTLNYIWDSPEARLAGDR
jgi:Protein of unknown function (DUF2568)